MSSFHQFAKKASAEVDIFLEGTFSSIHIDGPELNPSEIQKTPFMIVCTHRSHIDYFLLGSKLIKMGFRNLRFAAGDNLTKLPYIGPKFKSFGAFTVERDVGFERNYVKNLCNSVVGMLLDGEAVMVFPEGGRSYSGSTMEIKSGVLGAAVLAQAKDFTRDVYFLPAAISYECPPDVPWFGLLLKGKRLRKKSNPFFKRFLGNIFYFGADLMAFIPFMLAKKTRRQYGVAYIDYLPPVSVKDIVDIKANQQVNARDEFSSHRASMQQVSEYIFSQFKRLYRILPIHVVAAVLNTNGSLTNAEITASIPLIINKLKQESHNTKLLNTMSSEQIAEQGIAQLVGVKALFFKYGLIRVRKPSIISYFASSID